MPILRRIVWSVFEIVDFSPGFDYVINWFLGAHGTLPERRAKYFDGAKAPTTQRLDHEAMRGRVTKHVVGEKVRTDNGNSGG